MVANLAQEMGLLFVLPSCLYNICDTQGFDGILDGREGELKGIVRDRALRGFMSLHMDYHRALYECFFADNDTFSSCNGKTECDRARKNLFGWLYEDGPLVGGLMDWGYLYDCSLVVNAWDDGFKLCERCLHESRKVMDANRKTVWQSLPEAFGLPPWEEMLKE